jgi:hypothetical protein
MKFRTVSREIRHKLEEDNIVFFLNGHFIIVVVVGTPDMVPSLPSTLRLYVMGGNIV